MDRTQSGGSLPSSTLARKPESLAPGRSRGLAHRVLTGLKAEQRFALANGGLVQLLLPRAVTAAEADRCCAARGNQHAASQDAEAGLHVADALHQETGRHRAHVAAGADD